MSLRLTVQIFVWGSLKLVAASGAAEIEVPTFVDRAMFGVGGIHFHPANWVNFSCGYRVGLRHRKNQ